MHLDHDDQEVAGRRRSDAVKRFSLAVAAVAVLSVALAACGSDNSSAPAKSTTTAASSTTSTSADTTSDPGNLDKFFTGLTNPGPTTGPAAQKGKTIWFSNCEAFE